MKNIISSFLFLMTLLCLSVFVFDPTHLYYELPWLDIPMHVMGGFGIASLILAFHSFKKKKTTALFIFSTYAIVGIGWELYELANDIMNLSPWNGWSDTLSDFINGAIGAALAYFFFKK